MLQMISAISSPEDRELMEVFYEKHIDLLFFEAKKHLSNREDIEDAVYSTFQRLIEKMDIFRTLDAPARARYAVVTVRNSCYMLSPKIDILFFYFSDFFYPIAFFNTKHFSNAPHY